MRFIIIIISILIILIVLSALISRFLVKRLKAQTQGLVNNTLSICAAIIGLMCALLGLNIIDVENMMLREAKNYLDKGKYEKAFDIYTSTMMENNIDAKINEGYMYAHGYGVAMDVDRALAIFDSVDKNAAKCNKLALLLYENQEGCYDDEIMQVLSYLLRVKDKNTLDYVSRCIYDQDFEQLSEEQKSAIDAKNIDLDVFYKRKAVGSVTSPHTRETSRRCEYQGMTYEYANVNDSVKVPFYNYILYELEYIELLDHVVY